MGSSVLPCVFGLMSGLEDAPKEVRPPCLTFKDTGDVLNPSKLEKTISKICVWMDIL